jgi:hypothetical protein
MRAVPVSIQKPACPSQTIPGRPGAGQPGARAIRKAGGSAARHGVRPVTRPAMAAISSKPGPRTGIGMSNTSAMTCVQPWMK